MWIRTTHLIHFSRAKQVPGKLLESSHCYFHQIRRSGKCINAVLNVSTVMTEVHCFANIRLEDSCFVWCKRFIVAVMYFLVDGCLAFFHSECCGYSVNEKRFGLQRSPIFQLSKGHRQQSAFVTCFVQTHCILHVQFVSCLLQKTFDVRFRSCHQKIIDVSSCFLLDVFSTWFKNGGTSNRRVVIVPSPWNS